jgi:transcriptional regulator with PAS, ATPase and Fis domain
MPMHRTESAVPPAVALRVESGSRDEGPWPELASLTSLKSRLLLAELQLLGRSPLTVTIVGPSGTGKTEMAKGIHAVSKRSTGPLLIENIGAMSESLAMSELFGHERGAYTGAVHHRSGLLRTAHGGTLVLDELTKAPIAVQHALLNVIEGRPFRPSGSDRYIQVDVRIIALASEGPPATPSS